MSCITASILFPSSKLTITVCASAVYTSFEKANSSAEKCIGFSPPYITQGTFPALRKALVATLPTCSLLDPFIVIDFMILFYKKRVY